MKRITTNDYREESMANTKLYIFKRALVGIISAMIPAWLFAQVSGSALDYMLQRPRVTKVYKNKKPFDHLFVDMGAGINGIDNNGLKTDAMANFGVGDWISPEHGVRFNIEGGMWKVSDIKVKYLDFSLDYMLNLTALASPGKYYSPHCFEIIGLAGIDYATSRSRHQWQNGWGVHLGMRGQLALSSFTYAYVEPRIGLIEDQVSHIASWHGYRPYGSVSLGFGYRLPEMRYRQDESTAKGFADGLFFSVMGGPALLINSSYSTWGDRFGGRMAVSLGKWFDCYNAVRITANATSIHQYNSTDKTKALGLQLDYMLNLHNLFGGINPERRFWMDFVAGVSYNRSADNAQSRHNSFGYGGGLQANLRLARGLAFSVEPRLDIYTNRYAPHTFSFDNKDVTASLLLGLTYTYNDRRAAQIEDVDNIHHSSISIVGGLANRLNNMSKGKLYAPIGRVSFTRWYAPVFAWRANIQGLYRGKKVTGYNFAQFQVGADWMTDLTALSCGYDRARVLSFKTIAGFGIGFDYAKNAQQATYFSPDVHLGGQMAVRLSNSLHFIVEPEVSYEFSKRLSPARVGRFMPSLAVGLEYSMHPSAKSSQSVETPTRRDFVSASIGTGYYTGNFGEMSPARNKLSFVGEVGYGHWFDGINGIHASISNTTVQRHSTPNNHNITSLSAGYMMNIKAATMGESSEGDLFQLTGIADLSLVGSNRNVKGCDMKLTMGGKVALQAGFQVSKNVEIYVEPSAVIYGKGVEINSVSHHPLEGEARLSIGTKFHF